MPWDSRGLDGGNVDDLLSRAEEHLAQISAEMEEAAGWKAGLEQAVVDAKEMVMQHQKGIVDLLPGLRTQSDQKLKADLARLGRR